MTTTHLVFDKLHHEVLNYHLPRQWMRWVLEEDRKAASVSAWEMKSLPAKELFIMQRAQQRIITHSQDCSNQFQHMICSSY